MGMDSHDGGRGAAHALLTEDEAAALLLGAAPSVAQVGTPALDRALVPIPAPRDAPYPGLITLDMDATDIDRRIVSVRQTIPVAGPSGKTSAGPSTRIASPVQLQVVPTRRASIGADQVPSSSVCDQEMMNVALWPVSIPAVLPHPPRLMRGFVPIR